MNLFCVKRSLLVLFHCIYWLIQRVEAFDQMALSGKELKVVIPHFPPGTMVYRNETGHVTGFGGVIYHELEWLSKKLNFSISMEASKDNNLGTLVNGTWDGIRGQLQREEVDLACSAFTSSKDDSTRELAAFIKTEACGILVKYPGEAQTSIYGIFLTFSLNVWIGLIISTIALICCIYFVSIFKKRYNPPLQSGFKTLSDSFLFIFGTISNQGGQYRRGHKSIGVIAVTWCFVCFAIVNIFSSCLTSYMSLTYQRPEIATFQDAANNPHYKLIAEKSSIVERIFREATSGTMKQVGDKYFPCGDACSMTNYEKMVNEVISGESVAVMGLTVSDSFMKKTISNRTCQLTIAQETIGVQHIYMAVPKKSPYVGELNKASLWYAEFGLMDYWLKKLAPRADQCRLNYNSHGGTVQVSKLAPFKLTQFYLVFLVLLVGYVLALIQFIREQLVAYVNRRIIIEV